MNEVYFGNPARAWLIAAALGIVVYLGSSLIARWAAKRIEKISALTETMVDDLAAEVLRSTRSWFLFTLGLYTASFAVVLEEGPRTLLHRAFVIVFLLQVSFWGSRVIAFWLERYLKKRSLEDESVATSVGLIGFAVKFVFFATLVLLALQNLGFNITTLIAGLGVGGIAVALAVQNILGDLFASLTIVLDKPFVVGDFVVAGTDHMGTIEHIGLKTTRVRSLSGEQLVFANSDLLQSRLRNFKRMSERRVVLTLGVLYETDEAMLEKIPGMIREIIEAQEKTRFDRCHFLRFGGSSLDFELVYWVLSPEFNVYADIAQKVNVGIVRRFNREKIGFAYPTRTLYLSNPATPPPSAPA